MRHKQETASEPLEINCSRCEGTYMCGCVGGVCSLTSQIKLGQACVMTFQKQQNLVVCVCGCVSCYVI